MNVENILKVADAIEQHSIPDLGFNMHDWEREGYRPDRSGHNCETCACIGGWTDRVFGISLSGTEDDTLEVLGLDRRTGHTLFYPGSFRTDNFEPYDATPEQAVKVLRHLASTGKVDWSVAAPTSEPA